MESLDILDEHGEQTGEIKLRTLVHKEGNWHKAIHLWIINSRGELLVQKRSPNKDSHPNEWDISCAGHIPAGETSIGTVFKELKEELGINAPKEAVEFLFTHKSSSVSNNGLFLNNEFDDVYLVKLDLDISKIKLQTEELTEVKWIPVSELERVLREKDSDYVSHQEEYTKLIAILKLRDS